MSSEDTITRLQTCLDQLATQFYASLRYTTTHHPLVAPSIYSKQVIEAYNPPEPLAPSSTIPPSSSLPPSSTQPPQPSAALSQPQPQSQLPLPSQSQQQQSSSSAAGPSSPPPGSGQAPDPVSPAHTSTIPSEFSANIKELSHDLILKQKQIEGLIKHLPIDIPEEERKQSERMQALVKELEEVDKQREVVGLVKQACLDRVEGVIGGFKRVV